MAALDQRQSLFQLRRDDGAEPTGSSAKILEFRPKPSNQSQPSSSLGLELTKSVLADQSISTDRRPLQIFGFHPALDGWERYEGILLTVFAYAAEGGGGIELRYVDPSRLDLDKLMVIRVVHAGEIAASEDQVSLLSDHVNTLRAREVGTKKDWVTVVLAADPEARSSDVDLIARAADTFGPGVHSLVAHAGFPLDTLAPSVLNMLQPWAEVTNQVATDLAKHYVKLVTPICCTDLLDPLESYQITTSPLNELTAPDASSERFKNTAPRSGKLLTPVMPNIPVSPVSSVTPVSRMGALIGVVRNTSIAA